MALKAADVEVNKTTKKAEKPQPSGTWKDRFPGRITAEDAEREPKHKRLFPE